LRDFLQEFSDLDNW